jgi:lysozyme
VLEIYKDSLGLKTLGVGHLIQSTDHEYGQPVGTPVLQWVVDGYFDIDFATHLVETQNLVDDFDDLPENIQHVLVNMCFNLGATRLSRFRRMLGCANRHEWKEMAVEMEDSKWFSQVGRRSKELQELVLNA